MNARHSLQVPPLPQPENARNLLSCQTMNGMTPHCGYQNPEDLVHIPDTELLIVSEMGEFMADSPGALSLLNITNGQRQNAHHRLDSGSQYLGGR